MPPLELIEDLEEEELLILPPQLHTYPPRWLHLLGGIVGAPFPLPEAAEAIEDLSQNQDVSQGRPHNFFNYPLMNTQSFKNSNHTQALNRTVFVHTPDSEKQKLAFPNTNRQVSNRRVHILNVLQEAKDLAQEKWI